MPYKGLKCVNLNVCFLLKIIGCNDDYFHLVLTGQPMQLTLYCILLPIGNM